MKVICKFIEADCPISQSNECCFVCDKKEGCNSACLSFKNNLIPDYKTCKMHKEVEDEHDNNNR